MNIERLKKEFMKDRKEKCPQCHGYTGNEIGTFITEIGITNQNKELLDVLKKVKACMDSDDYNCNFDSLYETISAVINKYDN